ncbi:MAG: hypothetical protein DWQ47_15720 [Acidobacteria bacterium]|nr:MAG: hypothetical protein DWQ32_03120 [Acidobacteriota bacterium]REK02494.1 MAG: hypothetical protein DWQ38_09015 [Acidobacteriota bacterium]REK13704.1 MAG: hypothetical protein DWQ43_08810 [Acidobacteriota bacterium]REK41698.1 MAG: hypothetical protein DWQ47_15720 [Acidobacteriota bacterium]
MLAKTAFFFIVPALIFHFSGCGSGDDAANSANGSNAANASPAVNEAPTDPLGGIEKTPTPAEKIEAVTLKPVVDAFCSAMKRRDEAALRRVYSRATIQSFERDMQKEGTTSLVEFLSDEPVGNRCEVVNERIQGNVGEAMVTTQTYPNGIMIKFVKEGAEWKLTNQSSDFDAVQGGS